MCIICWPLLRNTMPFEGTCQLLFWYTQAVVTFGKQFNMNTVRKLRFSVDVDYAKHGVEKHVIILYHVFPCYLMMILYPPWKYTTQLAIVNTEFRKVCEFFRMNRLVLHPDNSKFMLFSRCGGGRFFAATITWDRTWLRTLGWSAELLLQQTVCRQLNFNPNLNFKYHISTLKNKLSKSLYALRTVKKTLKPKKPFFANL